MLAILLPGMFFTLLLSTSRGPHIWNRDDPYQVVSRVGRTLMQEDSVIDLEDPFNVIGYILGCISATFYVMSRVPQIIKNVSTIILL